MRRVKTGGPGPSHLLITPGHVGNVVGIDPHKRTLTATVADARGGIVVTAHFRGSGEGHRELEAWARQFGQIARWGVEGSASWGRHTAMLTSRTSCCALWHNRRRSILTSRQHLVGEAEAVLCDLPLDSQSSCRTSSRSNRGSPRSPAATAVDATTPTRLRLQLLDGYRTQIAALDLEEQHVVAQLRILFRRSGSTLGELCGLSTRSSPSCWSRSATHAASPSAASHASTAQRRYPPRPLSDPANRSATATAPAATGGSTRSST